MLDRKTKSYDASLELLEDRCRQNEITTTIVYVTTMYLVGITIAWLYFFPMDTTAIYVFITLSFTAGFLSIMTYISYHRLCMYIFLIKRGCTKKQKE